MNCISAIRSSKVGVNDGRCTLTEGRTSAPDAVAPVDMQTLPQLLSQTLSPTDALAHGPLEVAGDSLALERFIRKFPMGQAREAIAAHPVGPTV
jgi:putative sterol carrier protein